MRNPRILLVGGGRSGKDTAGEIIEQHTGWKFAGTTSKYLCRHVAAKLGLPEDVAYARRHESDAMRVVWFETGNELRKDDPALLAREAFAHGDVTGGVRGKPEIEAIIAENLADLIVWVSRDVPPDPTMEFGREYADVVLDNNGTLDEFRRKVTRLMDFHYHG